MAGLGQRAERQQRLESRRIQAEELQKELDNRLAIQRLANAGALARQQASNTGALQRQGMANTGAINLANVQGGYGLRRQETANTGALNLAGLNNESEMKRLKLKESGLMGRLKYNVNAKQEAQNKALGGQALLAGLPGDQAQQIAEGRFGGANLSGIQMPAKRQQNVYSYITPTVDAQGKMVSEGGVFNKQTGAFTNESTINAHVNTIQSLDNDDQRMEYLKALQLVDPAGYIAIRNRYVGE